jgi:AcrR family transcriptional regulator
MAAELTARQRDIVAAALDLLEREGDAALTMANVAGALGIRAPSLYKHFAGKAELEAAVLASGLEQMRAAFAAAPPTLAGVAAAYRAWALANPRLHQLHTQRPLPRELLPEGLEAATAEPLVRALGGHEHLARAAWSFAAGMATLETAGRFPAGADVDAAWDAGVAAFAAAAARRR